MITRVISAQEINLKYREVSVDDISNLTCILWWTSQTQSYLLYTVFAVGFPLVEALRSSASLDVS